MCPLMSLFLSLSLPPSFHSVYKSMEKYPRVRVNQKEKLVKLYVYAFRSGMNILQ